MKYTIKMTTKDGLTGTMANDCRFWLATNNAMKFDSVIDAQLFLTLKPQLISCAHCPRIEGPRGGIYPVQSFK